MNFSALSVSKRLALAFGIVLAATSFSAVFSISKLAAMEMELEKIALENNVKIKLNNDMNDTVAVVSRVMRSIILIPDRAAKEHEMAKVVKSREEYEKAWTALQAMPASEAGHAMRNKISAARDIARPLNNKVLELGMAGKEAEATALLMQEANPATIKWQDALEENIALQEAGNAKYFEEAQSNYKWTRDVLIAVALLTVILAVLAAWFVTRSITHQLGAEPADAARIAQDVANGDLSRHIDVRAGDTSSLMAQLKLMQESLSKVVLQVRTGSESVAMASSEIAQGNNDLSARTEQQASALEETAASMEELGSTVKQNAESAKQANQLAMNASTVAVQGGTVVGEVVTTMKDINESSRRISDIISVIDGIAFQTNILALNAAVEAARAGEQGRGFAVVASEVRSLAGRSAEAAKEIKTLINASVEKVEQGTALVDKAGSTMSEVVTSIKRVTDIMAEISAASSEQSAGVNQVGEAVSQMDQTTQQNAALVEQMAAAASSLKVQASELVQVVATFKLGGADATHTRAAAPAVKTNTHRAMSAPRAAAPHVPAKPKAAPILTAKSNSQAPAVAAKPPATGGEDDDWETF